MLLMMIVFFIFLFMGAPIIFAFAFSSIAYAVAYGMQNIIPPIFYSSLDSFPLLAIPFFVYAGDLMTMGGISKRLLSLSTLLVGKMKGFLGYITVVTSAFFAAISGSGIATVAAVGKIMIPEMIKHNYPRGYASVLTASAAILGVIIPPSIPMILYSFAGNVSVLRLFLGGVTPGILLTIAFLLVHRLYVKRLKLAENDTTITTNTSKGNSYAEAGKAIPALLMPAIIILGIYSGLFTATEAALVAVIYSILVGFFVYRELKWNSFIQATLDTARTTTFILATLVFATVFARILTLEQVPLKLANFMTSLFPEDWMIFFAVIILLLIAGMFIDIITGVIIISPILIPIAGAINLDLAHFGVVLVVCFAVGSITPPLAANLFLGGQIAKAPFTEQMRYVLPFILISVVVIFLMAYIPGLVLWLPNLML